MAILFPDGPAENRDAVLFCPKSSAHPSEVLLMSVSKKLHGLPSPSHQTSGFF